MICIVSPYGYVCTFPPLPRSQAKDTEGGLSGLRDRVTSWSLLPWPRLGTEPLKVWTLIEEVNSEPDCFSGSKPLTDTMCRRAASPLNSWLCQVSYMDHHHDKLKCSRASGSVPTTTSKMLNYFSLETPLVFVFCLWSLWMRLSHSRQKKICGWICVQWFPALEAEKKEPQVPENKLPWEGGKKSWSAMYNFCEL